MKQYTLGDLVQMRMTGEERFYLASDVRALLERIAFQFGAGDTPQQALADAHDKNVMLARSALGHPDNGKPSL